MGKTQGRFGRAANDERDELNPTSYPSLVFAQPQTIVHFCLSAGA